MLDFLGKGWSFPIRIDARRRISLSGQNQDVEEAILIILRTPKGQRVMRPEFGCLLHNLIFAPNDATTAGLAVHYVQEALLMWEPRIRLIAVEARQDSDQFSQLLIVIHYEIKATLDSRSLVHPFYLIPERPQAS